MHHGARSTYVADPKPLPMFKVALYGLEGGWVGSLLKSSCGSHHALVTRAQDVERIKDLISSVNSQSLCESSIVFIGWPPSGVLPIGADLHALSRERIRTCWSALEFVVTLRILKFWGVVIAPNGLWLFKTSDDGVFWA